MKKDEKEKLLYAIEYNYFELLKAFLRDIQIGVPDYLDLAEHAKLYGREEIVEYLHYHMLNVSNLNDYNRPTKKFLIKKGKSYGH